MMNRKEEFGTAEAYYTKLQKKKPIMSHDPLLDDLLGGGCIAGIPHLIAGPKRYLSQILMQISVNAFLPQIDGGILAKKVVYIDGLNQFNPYLISKLALSNKINPQKVLDNILIARAFNWNQMVEIIEEQLNNIENIDVVLIAGLTEMFQQAITKNEKTKINRGAFQDLNRIITGLKQMAEKNQDNFPIIILTGAMHPHSRTRPLGGRILSHFAGIVVRIENHERFVDYYLDQHPYLSQSQRRLWKPLEERLSSTQKRTQNKNNGNNTSLDFFMK